MTSAIIPTESCLVRACTGSVFNKKRGLCRPHYNRYMKYGDVHGGSPVLPPGSKVGRKVALRAYECSVDDCGRQALAKRLCVGHYSRLRTHGDVQAHVPLRAYQMSETDQCRECSFGVMADGLCSTHYYQTQDQESRRVRTRSWALAHPVRMAEHARAYRDRHPESAARRSATQVGKTFMLQDLRERDGDLCCYCGIFLNFEERRDADGAHLEHITPLSRGGAHSMENCALACRTCNLKKKDKTPLEFLSVTQGRVW